MEKHNKKILILTADAGFGHRSASLAIQSAIEDLYPDQYIVSLVNPLDNNKAPFFIKESQSEYDKWVRNVPELYKFGYELSDSPIPVTILETILVVSLFEVINEMIEEHEPDIIINTYPLYQAPFVAVKSLTGINIPMLTIVTDLATVHQIWFNDKVDWLIVPTEIVRDDAIEAGVNPDNICVIGIPVNPRIFQLNESKQELKRSLGWNPELTTILAVGSKRVEHFKENLDILNHSGFQFQLIVVTGKDQELYEELKEVEWHHETYLYEFVDQMPEFMRASDLLVAKAGGLIVTEALASGLPMILIDVIPGQESGNAKFVQDGKAGFWTKSSIEFMQVLGHLFFTEQEKLMDIKDNAKTIGKPTAAMQIAEFIINKVETSAYTTSPKVDFIQKIEDILIKNQIQWKKKP
ncbi:MAG: glycosyltransferase [Anaerolineaceae bacterium]|nr:glycosyltransferase [Anaerolineaceae bacterium]